MEEVDGDEDEDDAPKRNVHGRKPTAFVPKRQAHGFSSRLSRQGKRPFLLQCALSCCADTLRPGGNSMMRTTTWMRSKLTKRQSDPSMDASRQLLSRRPKCQPGRPGRPGPGSNRRAQTENNLRTINIVIYRHAAGPVESCQVSARGVT